MRTYDFRKANLYKQDGLNSTLSLNPLEGFVDVKEEEKTRFQEVFLLGVNRSNKSSILLKKPLI